MFENSYIYFVTFVFLSPFPLLCKCSDTSRLPTELWCVNSDCSEPISEGVVQILYYTGVEEGISLKPGHKVKIYSKSATPGVKRWEVENNGKRGFVPEGIITEKKVIVKKSDLKRVAFTDRLAVKIDSAPVVDVLKHDIEDVEAIIKRPSLVSSFAIPGSLADDSLKDVKDKINPQNVRVVVGTTIYDDLSDTSTPYASYTSEDPISGDSKPPVQSVGTTEKVPDGVSKSEVGKVDSVVKKEVVNDQTTKSKIDASEQTTESSSVFSSTPDMKSKNVVKQESVIPTPETTEDEEFDFYGDDEDEDDEEGGDEEEEEEEEEVEGVVVGENNNFVSTESSDEIHKGKGDRSKEQVNQVTPPVNEVSENGTKDAVKKKDSKDVEKTIEKDKVSEKKPLEVFDQAVKVTEQNISISVESTEKLDEIIQKDSDKPEIKEKIESVENSDKSEIEEKIESAENNVNATVISQVTEVPTSETNITTDSSSILGNITDSEKYLRPFLSTDSNLDKPPVSTPPDENKDNENKKFENVSQMASDETVSPDPLTVDSSVTLHTFIKKHDSLEELSSKINAKQSELDNVKLDQKDKDPSTFNELSESDTKVNEQINVSTENQGSVDGLVGSTPTILETEKSVVNKDAEGVLQESTTEISNDSIDSTKTVESVETFEATTQYPIENPLLPPKMDVMDDYHEHYTEIPSTRNDEIDTQQMPEEESTSVIDETESSGLEVDEGDNSESGGWFDFGFITNLFSSTSEEKVESQPDVESDIPVEEPQENFEQERTTITSHPPQIPAFKETDEHCTIEDGVTLCNVPSYSKESDNTNSWDVVKELLNASQTVAISTDSIIYLIITAITVILFSLGYYYIENHKYDGVLVAKINVLERDLLIVKKEAALFQEKLTTAESQVLMNKDSLSEFDEQLSALTQELEETRAAKLELEEQYVILEKEFDAATESGLEMHRLLTESFSTQDGSQVLFKTVESLREKLDSQDGEIRELKQLLSEKSEEIEKLHEGIKNENETRKALEDKLLNLRREKDEELLQINDKSRTLSSQLGDIMEEKSLIELKLSNELSKLRLLVEDTQSTLADREGEIDTLREAIAKLNKHDKEENLEALYDTAKVTSKLLNAEKERDNYKEKFLEEEGARKLLEDHVQLTRQEVNSLKENYEAAEKEKIEALTKLQVLSNYFKEKESQLQKELGTQESMWLQKQSDDHTIYEQMKSLREENEKYKLQNESLKKEICESESAFKIQIANSEQKAHDNWLASRQLERRLKETQNEATQLRNRLTLVEKNATNSSSDDLKQNMSYGIVESNGDPSSPPPTISMFPPATSPPFMMFGGPPPPPPTSEFLPPPPPPPLGFPEGRPAPVGRISSPPLDHSFSPPPPLPYFYDSAVYGGQHSPSPPPHRPMPKPMRDMGMDQKDRSSPPRHSEQQERTGRRSKR